MLLLWSVHKDECKIAWTSFFPFYQKKKENKLFDA